MIWMLLLHLHNINANQIIQIKENQTIKVRNMTFSPGLASPAPQREFRSIEMLLHSLALTSYQAKRILRTAIDNELLHIKLVDVLPNGAIIELDYELKTMDELFKCLNIITKQKANVILNDVGVILEYDMRIA